MTHASMRRLEAAVPVGFSAALAAYWFIYLRHTGPSVFGDTGRYFDLSRGWSQVLRFDLHQGAFFPVALFQAASDAHSVFLVNSLVWIVAWTALSAAIVRRCDARSAIVVNIALLLIATTSQVVGWLGAVLTESIATSIAVVVVAAVITSDALPASHGRQASWITAAAGALLFLTRPFMLLALLPLIAVAMQRRGVLNSLRGVASVAITLALVLSIVSISSAQPYADGLSFNGWYAMTRAVHFARNRELSPLSTDAVISCDPLKGAIEASISRGYTLGLVPEISDALRACPEQVRWLNADAPGVGRLLLEAPAPTLVAAATSAGWIAKPDVYPSHLLGHGTWGQSSVHRLLTPWESGPYMAIAFAVLVMGWTRRRSALSVLSAALLAGVVVVGALAILTDGIEQPRHASIFNVLSLVAMALSLDSTRRT